LGSRFGLDLSLQELGLDPELARDLAERVKNGAVLIGASVEDSAAEANALTSFHTEGATVLRLHSDRALLREPALVTRPQAPAADQRAQYEPAIVGQDIADQSGTTKMQP